MSALQAADGEELRDLYRELILDHARHPRHFGTLENATHSADGINPLCGDKLHLYLDVGDGVIRDAAFEGTGCAISVASASLMTETITGLDVAAATEWSERIMARLTGQGGTHDVEFGKLRALEGVREFPSRVKCATLAWHALRSAIEHESTPASSE